MATNEGLNRRLKALESRANPEKGIKIIVREGRESNDSCMKRHGYSPELDRAWVIVMEQVDVGVL